MLTAHYAKLITKSIVLNVMKDTKKSVKFAWIQSAEQVEHSIMVKTTVLIIFVNAIMEHRNRGLTVEYTRVTNVRHATKVTVRSKVLIMTEHCLTSTSSLLHSCTLILKFRDRETLYETNDFTLVILGDLKAHNWVSWL